MRHPAYHRWRDPTMDAGEVPSNANNSTAANPRPRLKYIHPVDLLLARVRIVPEETGDLVDITLGNYELYYCRMDGRSMCSSRLREKAYCDPDKERYPRAREALKLAVPTAVGIGNRLRWGMGQRAGMFETEVRSTLAELNEDVADFPNLALYPVLEPRFARWEPNLEKLGQLENELSHAAVESRDPTEWNQALEGAMRTVILLENAFAAYHLAARDQTADLADPYKTLLEAMTPVEEKLVEIGPRLLCAFDDQEEIQWLLEHVPHWFTQCVGNLSTWQRHARSPKRTAEGHSLPSAFRDAWRYHRRLGDLVWCALGEPNVVEASGPKPRRRRHRAGRRCHEPEFVQAREDVIAQKIRELAREGKVVTSEAVSVRCAGSDGSRIPPGTVRNSKAWKRREKISAEVVHDPSYVKKYKPSGVLDSDRTPVDEPDSSES